MAKRQLACSRHKYHDTRAVLSIMGVKIREVHFPPAGAGPEVVIDIEHDTLAEGLELMGLMFLPETGGGVIMFRAVLTTLAALIEAAQAGAVAAHQVTPAPLA